VLNTRHVRIYLVLSVQRRGLRKTVVLVVPFIGSIVVGIFLPLDVGYYSRLESTAKNW
jgi:hypothetical protein